LASPEPPIQQVGDMDVAPDRQPRSEVTRLKALRERLANFQPVKLGIQHLLKFEQIGKFLLTSLYGRDDKTI
jgi:hypothetical protein